MGECMRMYNYAYEYTHSQKFCPLEDPGKNAQVDPPDNLT